MYSHLYDQPEDDMDKALRFAKNAAFKFVVITSFRYTINGEISASTLATNAAIAVVLQAVLS